MAHTVEVEGGSHADTDGSQLANGQHQPAHVLMDGHRLDEAALQAAVDAVHRGALA